MSKPTLSEIALAKVLRAWDEWNPSDNYFDRAEAKPVWMRLYEIMVHHDYIQGGNRTSAYDDPPDILSPKALALLERVGVETRAEAQAECDRVNALSDTDPVHRPAHYTAHPSGIEAIQITEWMGFCLGNAVKYIWRAGLKSEDPIQDLEKARWYIDREIQRLKRKRGE